MATDAARREVTAPEEAIERLRALNQRALNQLVNRLRLRKTNRPATPTQLAAMAIYRADAKKKPGR